MLGMWKDGTLTMGDGRLKHPEIGGGTLVEIFASKATNPTGIFDVGIEVDDKSTEMGTIATAMELIQSAARDARTATWKPRVRISVGVNNQRYVWVLSPNANIRE